MVHGFGLLVFAASHSERFKIAASQPIAPAAGCGVCLYKNSRIATLFLRGKTISALGKNPVLTPNPSKNIIPQCRVPLRLRAIFGLVTQSPWSVRYGGLLSIR